MLTWQSLEFGRQFKGKAVNLEHFTKILNPNVPSNVKRKKTLALEAIRDVILDLRQTIHGSRDPRPSGSADSYDDPTRFYVPRDDPEELAEQFGDAQKAGRPGTQKEADNQTKGAGNAPQQPQPQPKKRKAKKSTRDGSQSQPQPQLQPEYR